MISYRQETKQGYLDLPWGKIWYKTVGDSNKPPLLVLHGGPGYPSDYLFNLGQLADDYFIVFYDQLGCGRSDRINEQKYWTVEYFVQELTEVIQRLDLKSINLFGHSWGTMLATDFLLTKPTGVKSIIFASPCISIPLWQKATSHYLDDMPNGQGNLIRQYEQAGNTQAPEYQAAKHLYHTTHENRIDPEPENVKASNVASGKEVYRYMWGPNEYTSTGTLRSYDQSANLHEINLPTLFTCGRYDGASPQAVAYYQSQISGSQMQVFEHSSHMAHLEEESAFIASIRNFLQQLN